MPINDFDININVKISIPMLGDESIMLIAPPVGFIYRKVPFDGYEYKEKMIDGSGNVSFDFYFAVHGDIEKYVIVLEHEEDRIVKHDKPANSIGFMMNNELSKICENIQDEYEKILFQYFAMIHLFKEGEVARKHSFYKFVTKEGICENVSKQNPVCADMITLILYPMIISQTEVDDINSFLHNHDKAYEILKNVVINDIEYTYHILDDATNYKNLITSLEVMFLEDDYGSKKEMLSKRIAVFLKENDAEAVQLYEKIKKYYTDRSNAVHSGITEPLTRDALNTLRNLVREATKKYIGIIETELSLNPSISFIEIKEMIISNLIQIVTNKNTANIWTQAAN